MGGGHGAPGRHSQAKVLPKLKHRSLSRKIRSLLDQ